MQPILIIFPAPSTPLRFSSPFYHKISLSDRVRNKSLERPTGLSRPQKTNRGGACPASSAHAQLIHSIARDAESSNAGWLRPRREQSYGAHLISSLRAALSLSIPHLPSPAPSTKNTKFPCMEMWVSHSKLSPKNAFLNWCFGECRIHWLQYVFTPDFESFSVENWRSYLATISSPRYSSLLFFFFYK